MSINNILLYTLEYLSLHLLINITLYFYFCTKKIKGKCKSQVAEFMNQEYFDMPSIHVTEFFFILDMYNTGNYMIFFTHDAMDINHRISLVYE